jgi:hypothetical protein
MKKIPFIISVGFIACVAASYFLPAKSVWSNPFKLPRVNVEPSGGPLVNDQSAPARFDRLLYEGNYTQAMLLLHPHNKILQEEQSAVSSVELDNLKREIVSIPLSSERPVASSIIVFYSFDLAIHGVSLAGRRWLAIEWRPEADDWICHKIISSEKLMW